jgi:hypothetical protein
LDKSPTGIHKTIKAFWQEQLLSSLSNWRLCMSLFLIVSPLRVRINVANEVAIFAMKGITIGQRTKAKDYYDLFMLAEHFKGGPKWLAQSLISILQEQIGQGSDRKCAQVFRFYERIGPHICC